MRLDVADNSSARATRLIVIGLDDLHVQGKTQELKDMARKVVEGIGSEASLALVTSSGRFGVEPTADRSLLLSELDGPPGGYILRATLSGDATSVTRELGFIVRGTM